MVAILIGYIIISFLSILYLLFKIQAGKSIITNESVEKALEIANTLADYPSLTEDVLYEIAMYRQIKYRETKKKIYRIF